MNIKQFLKPSKAKFLVLFFIILPLAFITLGLVFIIGVSTLAPLGTLEFTNVLMAIVIAFLFLYFWPLGTFYIFWQREMSYLVSTQSHSFYVWQGFGPYLLGLVVIINILWLYTLACLIVNLWSWRKKRNNPELS